MNNMSLECSIQQIILRYTLVPVTRDRMPRFYIQTLFQDGTGAVHSAEDTNPTGATRHS